MLHGKGVFANWIKDLKNGEIILDYLVGPSVFTRVLISERGRQESQLIDRVNVSKSWLSNAALKMEQKNAGSQKLEKAREWILP